jgi:hypothetical protein
MIQCVQVLGAEAPLTRRLALAADTSSAAELMEDLFEATGTAGGAGWDLMTVRPDPARHLGAAAVWGKTLPRGRGCLQ